MGFYLVDNPPARSQYRPRRADERGVIVVHTAENTPDFVAFDGGAEAVARFIRDRSTAGSYHELVDSDSSVPMVPDDAEAFGDATGSNPWAWHLSVATRADVWTLTPETWRAGAVEQAAQAAARYAHRLRSRIGIVIPACRITRAESEAGVPGFISHGDRDPERRHDPGADFPWAAFLARFDELTEPLTDEPGDDDMAKVWLLRAADSPAVHIIGADLAGTPRWVPDEGQLAMLGTLWGEAGTEIVGGGVRVVDPSLIAALYIGADGRSAIDLTDATIDRIGQGVVDAIRGALA